MNNAGAIDDPNQFRPPENPVWLSNDRFAQEDFELNFDFSHV
jgi:hypothetical protein